MTIQDIIVEKKCTALDLVEQYKLCIGWQDPGQWEYLALVFYGRGYLLNARHCFEQADACRGSVVRKRRNEEMTMIDENDLEHRALAELQASQQIRIRLELSIPDLMSLIGPLQLALRHLAFPSRNAQFIRRFIQQIKIHLIQQPALCEVIDLGFDPAFDYEPGQER